MHSIQVDVIVLKEIASIGQFHGNYWLHANQLLIKYTSSTIAKIQVILAYLGSMDMVHKHASIVPFIDHQYTL